MKLLYKYNWFFINILVVYIVAGCMSDYDPIDENDELVFKKSYAISVPPYHYITIESDTIYVGGDSSFYMNIPDTVNSTPVLSWRSVNLKLNMAAIFKDSILVTNNSIVNTNDIVWVWHSGFRNGQNGYLLYKDGKSIMNGNINDTISPEPLFVDSTYFWSTWCWNNEGIQIWYSSRPLSFIIKK